MSAWTRWICVSLLLTGLGGLPGPGAAQEYGDLEGREEALLLQEATMLERQGRYEESERRLRYVLEKEPGTAAAVFGLERVLRRQGRLPRIFPVLERYLETETDGASVRQLEIRLLAEVDSLDALREAAREWIRRDPDSLEPYRRILPVYEEALGPEPALALVEEARSATGRPGALALEAGDVLARSGDHEAAGEEWSRAIGEEGSRVSRVLARIEGLPGDTRDLVSILLQRLEEREDVSVSRLRGGARLALAAGLAERAVEIAAGAAEDLEGPARKGFLVQLAHRAREEELPSVALWAYERLRSDGASGAEGRALDGRIAELALATGDTARALEARDRIAASHEPGTAERRRAEAASLALEIEMRGPEEAAERIAAFRSRFPEAPGLDGLAARVARRLVRAGEEERASRILEGVRGPRSALERAYLSLGSGEVEKGVEELDSALVGASPARATEIVALVSFLEGAGPRAAELAGRVATMAHRGRTDEALERLRDRIAGVSVADRPGLLALGARLGDDAGATEVATALRASLVEEHPESPHAPEAAVRLARARAGDPDGDREAVRILEDLILERPQSAVVPEARRELEKLRARIPGSEGR